MQEFSELDLEPSLLAAVESAGYKVPTPIQAQAIPPALIGRDVLGIAQTGTGKTASFALPIISALSKGRARARMPRSLIIAPTRELAMQVAQSFSAYSQNTNLSMALLIGGVSFNEQLALIDRGADVLIATPGRLLDHFDRGKLLLSGVQILVVDEADRMLDMGFIPDVERIIKLTPFTRQTLFYSATMAPEIERLTTEFLSNPVRIEVAPPATVVPEIDQTVHMISPSHKSRDFKEKRALLRGIIHREGRELKNGIVFCNRKSDVDILNRSMTVHKFQSAAIHGDLDQSIRTKVLDDFRNGKIRFLIASDVAARGLDIPDMSHVFNFDVPSNPEDYVHRIGRTGRAGQKGTAIMICGPRDRRQLEAIENLLGHELTKKTVNLETDLTFRSRPMKSDDRRRNAKRGGKQHRDHNIRHCSTSTTMAMATDGNSELMIEDELTFNSATPIVGMGDHVPAFLKRDSV